MGFGPLCTGVQTAVQSREHDDQDRQDALRTTGTLRALAGHRAMCSHGGPGLGLLFGY